VNPALDSTAAKASSKLLSSVAALAACTTPPVHGCKIETIAPAKNESTITLSFLFRMASASQNHLSLHFKEAFLHVTLYWSSARTLHLSGAAI
jgi:hypothetical protein